MEHDNSYKLFFSHPEMVSDLLRGYVDRELVNGFDFSTLEKISGSFVTDDIRDRESDLIWRIRCNGEWVYTYLLLEFQSTNDHFMAARICAYMGLLYGDLIRTKKVTAQDQLPDIIPIVIYNGENRWKAPQTLNELLMPVKPELEKLRLSAGYLLIDIGCFGKMDLSGHANFATALFRLENGDITGSDIDYVMSFLVKWYKPDQDSLDRAFAAWISKRIEFANVPGAKFAPFKNTQEARSMISERMIEQRHQWEKQVEQGKLEGKLEGEIKSFLIILNAKFGEVSEKQHELILSSKAEQIEAWMKLIFQASSIDDLLLTQTA